MNNQHWLLYLMCHAACSSAQASGQALLTEADYFAEQPIVLSVSRLSQPFSEAPAAVTVIDRAMIEASGYRHVVDLLRLVPGFQVTWTQGNLPAVTYHGLSSLQSRRMQVLVDGRSVYNPGYGQVFWRALPVALEDIDRIEVVRGPNAANDGVNAFQATIHIYTRHAASAPGSSVTVGTGENEARDLVASFAHRIGDLDLRLTAQYRHDRLFDRPYYPRRDETTERILGLRADYRIDARSEFTAQLGYTWADWQNSAVAYDFNPAFQSSDMGSRHAHIKFRRLLDVDDEWSVQLHHTRSHSDEDTGLVSISNLDTRFRRDALEFNAIGRLDEATRLSWAAEVRRDAAWSPTFTDRDREFSGWMYRLSGALERQLAPDWQFHAAAMLEKHYYAGTRLSPRLALIWRPVPAHSLRLAATRGYRSPNFLEQNADFKSRIGGLVFDQYLLSPNDLKPERITTAELGYVLHLPAQGVDADLRLFHNRIAAMIDFSATPAPVAFELCTLVPGWDCVAGADLTFENNVRAEQTGLDVNLRWRWGRQDWLNLWLALNDTRSNSSLYARSAPDHSWGLLGNHALGEGLEASLGYTRVGRMTWLGALAPTPERDRLDLRIARRWCQAGTDWEASLVLQSALGGYYEYENARYLFDRRAYASLRAGF